MSDRKPDPTLSTALAEAVGRTVGGRYRLGILLGRGGVGAVYEAEHLQTGGTVAVKVLLPGLPDAVRVAERFRREARVGTLLDHPNIVELLDLVAEDDTLYLVMERVRGRSVAAVLEDGTIVPRRALVIARQVLDALAHAHDRGLIHRDIKADNIMLAAAGTPEAPYERVKLLDFGLVKLVGDAAGGADKLTQTGLVFGTPSYMAPEQALGRPLDGRADLYSLGIVLFEMLTGRRPYVSPDPVTLLRMQAAAPVPTLAGAAPGRPWCTAELEALIAGALAKRPDDRFRDAAEMRAGLDRAFVSLDHLPAGA